MSGEGDDYTPDEVDDVYDALGEALEEYASRGGAGATGGADMTVQVKTTARVEWSGEYANNGRNGVRTTKLEPMNLAPVRDAVRKAQRLEALAGRGPLRTYKAKGWQAQLKQLQGTKRGQEALRAAGWNPSRETLRRYGKGTQAPSKANRARIAEAYDSARNPGKGWVEARKEAVDAFTAATGQQAGGGGMVVRLRDIEDLKFQ
jgi:hypothetical protein